MAPRRQNKTPMILAIVAVCLLCVCGGGGLAVWFFGKQAIDRSMELVACMANFEAVQTAIMEYANDHEGTLPKAETWQDDVRSYLVFSSEFEEMKDSPFEFKVITKDGEWCCQISDAKKTGMCFNEELSGKKLADIEDMRSTVLVFETDSVGRNQHAKYTPQPHESSPKFFGSHRGWMRVPVQGDVQGMDHEYAELKSRRRTPQE